MSVVLPSYSAYRVLVVDDQFEMIDLLPRMLRRMGFVEITTARSVKEADEMLNTYDFHLILTDFNMGSQTGLDLMKKLRTDKERRTTRMDAPVIMITGYREKDKVLAAREAGVAAFLAKPIVVKQFEEKVRAVLLGAPIPKPRKAL